MVINPDNTGLRDDTNDDDDVNDVHDVEDAVFYDYNYDVSDDDD